MFQSLSDMIQAFESGGNYGAQNPTSSASGAYQFTTPTWQQFAPMAGVDIGQYPTAASAPPAVQDQVFATTVQQVGLQPWTCSGCNANTSAYLAANPGAANLPVFTGGTVLASGNQIVPGGTLSPTWFPGSTYGGFTNPDGTESYGYYTQPPPSQAAQQGATPSYGGSVGSTIAPGGVSGMVNDAVAGMPGFLSPILSGGPMQVGITTGLASGISGWISNIEGAVGHAATGMFSGLFSGIQNWFLRAMLILTGLVLVALALWALLSRATDLPGPAETARAAAAA